jgi:hypothetical protein
VIASKFLNLLYRLQTKFQANKFRQAWIREKAVTDASRMYLRPLYTGDQEFKPYAFSPFHSQSLYNMHSVYTTPSPTNHHSIPRHKSYNNLMEKTAPLSIFHDINDEVYTFHSLRGDALLRKISSGLLASREPSIHGSGNASPSKAPYKTCSVVNLTGIEDAQRMINAWSGSRIDDVGRGMETGMECRDITVRS